MRYFICHQQLRHLLTDTVVNAIRRVHHQGTPVFQFLQPLNGGAVTSHVENKFTLYVLSNKFLFRINCHLTPHSLQCFCRKPKDCRIIVYVIRGIFITTAHTNHPNLLSSFTHSILLFLFLDFTQKINIGLFCF